MYILNFWTVHVCRDTSEHYITHFVFAFFMGVRDIFRLS